jgi:hypothetical protein
MIMSFITFILFDHLKYRLNINFNKILLYYKDSLLMPLLSTIFFNNYFNTFFYFL